MARGYLSPKAARKLGPVVRAFYRGGRNRPPHRFRTGFDDPGDFFRLARFAGTWNKGETKEVEQCDEYGDPMGSGYVFDVVNHAADVETPNEDSYGYLGACKLGRVWILMWFECDVADTGS